MSKKLTRSNSDVMVAGVAAGVADYLAIDPALVRLIFVLLTLLGGHGILIYLILWIVMPQEDVSEKDQGWLTRPQVGPILSREKPLLAVPGGAFFLGGVGHGGRANGRSLFPSLINQPHSVGLEYSRLRKVNGRYPHL
ncbi:MAG: PspC domain-containing protein [Chloroflexi bacterium]|nr:PspC domain-containing protein [Chloroflexota bacterium]